MSVIFAKYSKNSPEWHLLAEILPGHDELNLWYFAPVACNYLIISLKNLAEFNNIL
jgi:hypothetical protein